MSTIKVKFWGVRGSIPTPGYSTLKYGGNTPCVEVRFQDGPFFILDAGTGIRELGKELMQLGKPVSAYIFISHFHWDHIQGLPFFRPAHNPKNTFTIIGSDDTTLNLDQIISFQMDSTYFPIAIQDMKAKINFRSVKEEIFSIEKVHIETIYLNHPGYALGFKMTFKNKSIVYISDNEPFYFLNQPENTDSATLLLGDLEDIFDNFVENKDQRIVEFCRGVDLLIHDTQFFIEEYQKRVSWGHSPFNFTVDLALRSEVKQLILFHHDPDHDDDAVDKIEQMSWELIQKSGKPISCRAAQEGMVVEI
ncbi:MAG TPA: MBL fold metallo-hydrolase [Caldithrix sp.]|nr:MBL fold metallo-hydrolase [Caldithrix sp.]